MTENKTHHKSRRLPPWMKKRGALSENVHAMKSRLRDACLHTVCEEAKCPNIGECFARKTATFLIMGNSCTRNCGFCAVSHDQPRPLDDSEPERVAAEVASLKLQHAVITSVTRDDLPDGGALHFAKTISAIRKASPGTTVEVLIPDFEGSETSLITVIEAGPDVLNHNMETVKRLTPVVRSKADYSRSLELLERASRYLENGLTKSGFMLGLGENHEEVLELLKDLKQTGCNIVTIGQYLQPKKTALPVVEYVTPERFEEYERAGKALNFGRVISGPFVRSSYLADQALTDTVE